MQERREPFSARDKWAIVGTHSANGTSILRSSKNSGERPAILQIVPMLDAGGAERTTVDIAAALARQGFRPLVATHGGRLVGELQRAGGEWIELAVHSKWPATLLANIGRIRRIVRRQNIKLLHARSRAPAWSAFYAARAEKIPFVTTYHGIYNAKGPVKRYYNSIMARGDAVIANSEWTAGHIRSEHSFAPKRLAVIPRGVDLERFDPARISRERVESLRASWGARQGDIVVFLPGRLTRWKGQSALIKAMGNLKQGGSGTALRAVLAGDPQGRESYKAELSALASSLGLSENLLIADHIVDMPVAYLAADIVVSASTDPEAFGRVAAEAGAMGRPVVATDHGGSREIILRDKSGLLIAPGDPLALSAAIDKLAAAGPEFRRHMGEAARAHVTSHFTVERMCADTIALYRELLNDQP